MPGKFVRTKYLRDDGTSVHPIRVQEESITTWNAVPTAALNRDISAIMSRSLRTAGLHARRVYLQFPDTGQPPGYLEGGITAIPVLTPTDFAALAYGQTVQYLSVTCTVIGKRSEKAK